MSAKFGVNVTIDARASRPIPVESTTPIGIAGHEEALGVGMHFFMSTDKVLGTLKDAYEANSKLKKGSIYKALKGISDQAVNTQIILSVFAKGTVSADNVTACKTAIGEFTKAETLFGYRPNLIIAPEFSGEDAIKGEIETVAKRLKATGIIDLKGAKITDAITKMGDFGTRRLIASYPNVKVWDDITNTYVYEGQSARIAGMIARVDGESEFGYSDSYSNRVMRGVFGTQVPIEYVIGETCDADELRARHISTVIRFQGFRSWGGETSDIDTIWQDLARVRVFDRISEACQKGVFYAIDRKASKLYHAKRSVEELLRSLTGAEVLLGYKVFWSAKNTPTNITAGKFYLDIEMQNNPIVKQLTLDFYYVDTFNEVLMKKLSKE